MRWVVGLGNPGETYARTRHNAGFIVVDAVVAALGLEWRTAGDAWLATRPDRAVYVKPRTYMNLSGRVLEDPIRFGGLSASHVLVVVDDTALPLGTIRLRAKGSHGGHNGLRDIERALGTSDFARLRIGVGQPAGGAAELKEFVLADFGAEEIPRVNAMAARAAEAIEGFVNGEEMDRLMAKSNGICPVPGLETRSNEE